MYFYYRSLAVTQPCQVARENLLLLFEQNRVDYEQLGGSADLGGGTSTFSTAGGNCKSAHHQQQHKHWASIAALLSSLSTRFVRVHGALLLL